MMLDRALLLAAQRTGHTTIFAMPSYAFRLPLNNTASQLAAYGRAPPMLRGEMRDSRQRRSYV